MPAPAVLRPVHATLTFIGEITMILWDVVQRIWRKPYEVGETLNQMAFVGVASIPIVCLTNFFSGAVLALYSTQLFAKYGATSFIGGMVGMSVAREIGPVLAGIMVAARCGSAMAAQIGSMAVTEQIDALKMLSVNPTNYLVIPRIIACVVMLPILGTLGIYAGIFGGWLVATSSGVPSSVYTDSIQSLVELSDFAGGLAKTPFFGIITVVVACQQGLRTSEGAVGVGRATTNTVVISMVLVYVANFFLASILFPP